MWLLIIVQIITGVEELKLVTASEALELVADERPFECDFLGKAMDTGFRVAQLAKPERFTLSVQLAQVILDSLEHYQFEHEIRFDKPILLKGVNGGKPYPVLYMDTMQHLSTEHVQIHERRLLGQSDAPSRAQLREYLDAYCSVVSTERIRLPTEPGDFAIEPTKSYHLYREKIEKHLMDVVDHSQGEQAEGETDGVETAVKTVKVRALRKRAL